MTERTSGDNPDESFIRDQLSSIDAGVLGAGAADQYPAVPGDDIVRADDYYPPEGLFARLANEELERGKAQAEGRIEREAEYHDMGWELVIASKAGYVALWSCWAGDQISLQYDGEPLADSVVKDALGVTDSKAVWWGGGFIWGASDPVRKWGEFHGPKLDEGGRIWFMKEAIKGDRPEFINNNDSVQRPEHWLDARPNALSTFPHSFHNEESPESPSTDEDAIQRYRDGFIHLAAQAAFQLGQPESVSTKFAFMTYTPEELERGGYNIRWVKGERGIRKGWSSELVIAKLGVETVILKSANEVVPWSSVRRLEVPALIDTPAKLAERIIESDIYF